MNDNILQFPEFEGIDKKDRERNKVKIPKEARNAGLKIIAYPTNKHDIPQRPNMKNHTIPRHPSSVICNGKTGQGKSNLLVNLLTRPEFYGPDKGKSYFDIIYLFSPTANKCDDLVRFLNIPEKRIFTEFSSHTLENIIAKQKEIIIKKGDLLKSPKMLIIFDDIQTDKKFMNSKCFHKCFLMSRHYNISVYLCSQSFTKTPRACRLQANNIFFFEGSKSEHRLLVDEYNPPRMSKKEFHDLINYATEDDYSFLHVNMRVNPKERFRKNLETVLELQK